MYAIKHQFLLCTVLSFGLAQVLTPVKDEDMLAWATKLKDDFMKIKSIMQPASLQTFVDSNYTALTYTDTTAQTLLNDMVTKIETLARAKENVVQKLAVAAETSYQNRGTTQPTCNDFVYDRAKAISDNSNNSNPTGTNACQQHKYLSLTSDPLLFNMEVSKNRSTAHVPTNVYDGSKTILMVAKWTENMTSSFQSNRQTDTTLKFQYFGSRQGIMTIFPGVKWHIQIGVSSPVDFYDCRTLPWYTMAAAYTKEIVILVDKSGSMTGKRQIIANRTISEILMSLTENDYFNIIQMKAPKQKNTNTMQKSVHFLDDLYKNVTIQASLRNKHRMIDALSLKPSGVAQYKLGFEAAFGTFNYSRKTKKAIIVLSDGAPESNDQVLKVLNNASEIRIITYLIGKESKEIANLKKMACTNNGYFSHIMTLSDIRENVRKYLPVMARDSPNATPKTVWTGIHGPQVLGVVSSSTPAAQMIHANVTLFTTVSRVVYNKTSTTKNYAPLLGVVGVDVPVSDFQRNSPEWTLGTFGYTFMINNNGYLLFHPNFRYTYNGHLKPYYENTDLDTAEHGLKVELYNGFPNVNKSQLRTNMISRTESNLATQSIVIPDDFKSALTVDMKYFFKPIANSPFVLGLALRWKTGKSESYLEPNPRPDLKTLSEPTSKDSMITVYGNWITDCSNTDPLTIGVAISPYEFCHFPENIGKLYHNNRVCALVSTLLTANHTQREAWKCDMSFINRLQKDASVSQKLNDDWLTTDWEKYGIDQVFMLFYSGLTRFKVKPYRTNLSDPNFIFNHNRGMKDPLFQTTAVFAEESNTQSQHVYFHIPSNVSKLTVDNTTKNFSVIATSIVFHSATTPLAVAGAKLGYNEIKQIFLSAIATCKVANCVNGTSPDVDSYLISTNGYVVFSKNDNDVGKNFSSVDPGVMQSMINSGLFISSTIYDFQGVCPYNRTVTSTASRLIDPFRMLLQAFAKVVFSVTAFVLHLCVSLFWALVSLAAENPRYNVNPTPPWNSCGYKHTIYKYNFSESTKYGNFTCTGSSTVKEWKASLINGTNLILVIVSPARSKTQCQTATSFKMSPEALTVNRTKMMVITRGDYPTVTNVYTPTGEKNQGPCSSPAVTVRPYFGMIMCLTLYLLLTRSNFV